MRWWHVGSVVAVVAWCVGAPTQAAALPEESCAKRVGRARAARMVRQCLMVSAATRSPCHAENPCERIAEHSEQMCRELPGPQPAFCGESASVLTLSGSALVSRYADTVRAEQEVASSTLESLRLGRAKLAQLLAQRKRLGAESKVSQLSLQKQLKAARAAYARTKKAHQGSDRERLNALREVREQFVGVTEIGASLEREARLLDELYESLAKVTSEFRSLSEGAAEAARDAREAKALAEGLSAELAKAARERKAELAAREKAAAKGQAGAARSDDSLVELRETVAEAEAEATRVKATVAELKQAVNRVGELMLQIRREARAIEGLDRQDAAGSFGRARAARRLAEDNAAARATLSELEQRLEAPPAPGPAGGR